MKWYDRAKRRMKERKITQDDLIKVMGVTTRGSVGHYLNGRRQPDFNQLKALADHIGFTLDEMMDGESIDDKEQDQQTNNLSLPGQPDHLKKLEMVFIPLIAFDRAGEWLSVLKDHHPEDGEIMTKPIQGQDLFAVVVPDDAMRPEFWEDENIVIDPHMEPEHKSFVLVSMGKSVIFRQLWDDAGEWLLKPLNERYGNRPLGDNRIIGVVRRKVKETDYR